VDVDFAIITPPYSKDEVFKDALHFLRDNKVKVAHGSLSQEQADRYQRQYVAWKSGQEMPLEGTPILGWPVLTPAQQQNLILLNIPTVEYLAAINDEGMARVGMGALEQKRKAVAWLAQATDKGPLTQQMASIQTENDVLKMSVATLTKQVESMLSQATAPAPPAQPSTGLGLSDILDTDPAPTQRKRRA